VSGRARTCRWGVKGRVELRHARVQLERGRLVIEAVVGVCRVRLFGRRRHAWVTGAAGGGRGLGADDRRRAVDLAKVRERNLQTVLLAVLFPRRQTGRSA
jgi:hypothetical protein